MTKETLAAQLNGREYLSEITKAEEQAARNAGLVAIFGASDDLVEFRGALNDEAGAWSGATVHIDRDGKLLEPIESDEEEILTKHRALGYVKALRAKAAKIEVLWCAKDGGPPWTYETEMPHASFDIMEDGEVYCRGIVIDLKEIPIQ